MSAFPTLLGVERTSAGQLLYEYTAFCNGPGDVKSPRVIVTPPSSRFCPWSASRPPHFCNGPGDVKSPRVIVTPPSSRFCPWSASRPPHYAVRRNGEPI